MELTSDVVATVWEIVATAGQAVENGDRLLTLRSGDDEFPIHAPRAGRIAAIHVAAGDRVVDGDPLVTIE